MNRYARIINQLAKLASGHEGGHRQRHVAAVVRKGKVIATGFNTLKTSPAVFELTRNQDKLCIHAEVAALRRVQDAKGLELYVVRVGRNGKLNNSQPCENCQKVIDKSGLKRVIYTTAMGYDVVTRNKFTSEVV